MTEEQSTETPSVQLPSDAVAPTRRLYFINEQVEFALTEYIWLGCTRAFQRDIIMSNASELIRQIIRKQGLHTIYPGHDDSSFGDLVNTAWVQIEKILYKYRARPHCRSCYNPDRPSESILYEPADNEYGIKTYAEVIKMHKGRCPKCKHELKDNPPVAPIQGRFGGSETILYRGMSKVFNMWSQVARTVILAYIKKEGRDRKNSGSYAGHLNTRQKPVSNVVVRFLREARDIFQYNTEYLTIVDALEHIVYNDDRPYDGIISKLVDQTQMSRSTITLFMRQIKLHSLEFTDAPLNRQVDILKNERRKVSRIEFEDD